MHLRVHLIYMKKIIPKVEITVEIDKKSLRLTRNIFLKGGPFRFYDKNIDILYHKA